MPHNFDASTELNSLIDHIRFCMSSFIRADLFFGHGTDNEWDEAHSLVLQAISLPVDLLPEQLRALYPATLTQTEKQQVMHYLQERVEQLRPLPYITQQAWFAGLPFYVDERVLIPRSPMAELIKNHFQPFLANSPQHILDMCTGGACIAIALAETYTDATVDAVDIDQDALDVASINIHEYQLEQRVLPLQSDLFSQLQGQQYDLIVSNPPYVDAQDMHDLPEEFSHEPTLALAAGDDGLDLVETILREAPQYMSDDAWLFVEVGNSEVHMPTRFPGLDVSWVEFSYGGSGVFAINKDALIEYWQARAQ